MSNLLNARITKNDDLICLFNTHNFDSLFKDKHRLFLAWLYTESGHDQYCVRYEPQYRYIDKKQYDDFREKLSYGLFQMMGANLFQLGLPESQLENFLSDAALQFHYARLFLKKCPSTDINENLRWWNTGSTRQSNASDNYLAKIYTNIRLFSNVK